MDTPMKNYILLDRDGTIIFDKHYLSDPEGVEIIPNAEKGLKIMLEAGFGLIVVTNQSGIGRGYYSVEDMNSVNSKMEALLSKSDIKFDAIYHCPHTPDQACNCRKPATEMFDKAIAEFNLEPTQCYVIGDKICDIELGLAKGADAILVRTGKGLVEESECIGKATYIADDLVDAANYILGK